jgi:Na+/H+ antiporter NhaD/arsenite permease-like protein
LLAGLFILTAVLGQVISNTATALIIIPISVVAATQMGISPEPVLMAVGVAAAASFLTPVATPTNLMVMEPGSYKFTDYWKFGLPFMLWFFVVAVFWVPADLGLLMPAAFAGRRRERRRSALRDRAGHDRAVRVEPPAARGGGDGQRAGALRRRGS